MEYNKHKFLKANDKKVLHKVKKQWVVMSMAMLALLGGGAVAHKVSAHADVTNQSNTTLKNRLNQNLQQTNQNAQTDHSQNQLVNNHTYRKPTNNSQQITNVISQQANALHNRILCNTMNNQDEKNVDKNINPENHSEIPKDNTTLSNDSSQITTKVKVNFEYNNSDVGNYITNISGDPNQQKNITTSVNSNIANTLGNSWQRTSDKPVNVPVKNLKKHQFQLTPQPAGSHNISTIEGLYAYLSADGKTLTVTGNFSDLPESDENYSLFEKYSGVTTLNLGNIENPNDSFDGYSMKRLFSRMSDLQFVNQVGNWDMSRVTDVSYMFSSDPSLRYISPSLGNWDMKSINDMAGMFANDKNLKDISNLGKWNVSEVNDMSSMFQSDQNLKDISALGNWYSAGSLNSMSDMFKSDRQLSDFSPLSHWNMRVSNISGMFENTGIHDLTPLSDWNLMYGSYVRCDVSRLFESDQGLDLRPLSNWDTSNISDMFGMFRNASVLDLDALSNWDVSNVKNMDEMFSGVDIGNDFRPFWNWNTSKATMHDMFLYSFEDDGEDLDNLDIPRGWNINSYGTVNATRKETRDESWDGGEWDDFDGEHGTSPASGATCSSANLSFVYHGKVIGRGKKTGITNGKVKIGYEGVLNGDDQLAPYDAGYQVINPNQLIEYGHSYRIPVTKQKVLPSDTIQFVCSGKVVYTFNDDEHAYHNHGQVVQVGYDDLQIPEDSGYTFPNATTAPQFPLDGKVHQVPVVPYGAENVTVPVEPVQKKDKINYCLNGIPKGVGYFSGNDASSYVEDTSFYVTNSDDNGIPNGYQLVNTKNGPFNYDGSSHNVAIIPDQVNVKYIDRNNDSKTWSGTSPINPLPLNQIANKVRVDGVPEGYHIDQSNLNTYTINVDNSIPTIDVYVVGNSVSYRVPITIKYVNGNDQVQHNASGQLNVKSDYVPLNGHVDDIQTGFNCSIPNGYILADSVSDNPNTFKVALNASNYNWIVSNKKSESDQASLYTPGDNWDSTRNRPMLALKAGNAKDIILNYVNQSGQPIDYSDNTKSTDHVINSDNHYGSDVISGTGRYDDHVNVVNPNKQIPYSFNGYPNPDPQDYSYNSNNSMVNSDYSFTDNQQRVTIPLQGKSNRDQSDGDNALKVNFYAYDSYGNGTASPIGSKVIHIHSDIGSIATVKPDDFLASDGYGKRGKVL